MSFCMEHGPFGWSINPLNRHNTSQVGWGPVLHARGPHAQHRVHCFRQTVNGFAARPGFVATSYAPPDIPTLFANVSAALRDCGEPQTVAGWVCIDGLLGNVG